MQWPLLPSTMSRIMHSFTTQLKVQVWSDKVWRGFSPKWYVHNVQLVYAIGLLHCKNLSELAHREKGRNLSAYSVWTLDIWAKCQASFSEGGGFSASSSLTKTRGFRGGNSVWTIADTWENMSEACFELQFSGSWTFHPAHKYIARRINLRSFWVVQSFAVPLKEESSNKKHVCCLFRHKNTKNW